MIVFYLSLENFYKTAAMLGCRNRIDTFVLSTDETGEGSRVLLEPYFLIGGVKYVGPAYEDWWV